MRRAIMRLTTKICQDPVAREPKTLMSATKSLGVTVAGVTVLEKAHEAV